MAKTWEKPGKDMATTWQANTWQRPGKIQARARHGKDRQAHGKGTARTRQKARQNHGKGKTLRNTAKPRQRHGKSKDTAKTRQNRENGAAATRQNPRQRHGKTRQNHGNGTAMLVWLLGPTPRSRLWFTCHSKYQTSPNIFPIRTSMLPSRSRSKAKAWAAVQRLHLCTNPLEVPSCRERIPGASGMPAPAQSMRAPPPTPLRGTCLT